MATYFEGTYRKDVCDDVIGTGKRAFYGPQIHSSSMNPPCPNISGSPDPNLATAAAWNGEGEDATSLN